MSELPLTDLPELLVALSGPAGIGLWMLLVSKFFRGLENSEDLKDSLPIRYWLAGVWGSIDVPVYRYLLVNLIAMGLPIIATLILVHVPAEVIESFSAAYSQFSAIIVLGFSAQVFYSIVNSKV